MPSSTELLSPNLMRPYQKWMAERTYEDENLLLASFMGSGKTVSVLTAMRWLLNEMAVNKVLIVGPLLVAETVWPDEIETWSHLRSLRYEVLTGPPDQRLSRLNMNADVFIINRENVVWLWKHFGKKWPFDMVVWDESSRLKGGKKRSAVTTKVVNGVEKRTGGNLSEFGAMCNARKHIDRFIELTGTPAPNGVKDLWGQIYLLDGGRRLGMTKNEFLSRYFYRVGFKDVPVNGATEAVMRKVGDVMYSLKEEDYADLPELVTNTVNAPLSRKHLDQYKRFEKELVAEEYDVEAVNKGVLTNKLLQFGNGSIYNEEGADLHVHDEKIKALERIVEETNGHSILVAYSFQFDLARILKKFKNAAVLKEDSSDAIRKWNEGKLDMLLVHPASAGHGLNLQRGGHIAVWYGVNWSLELYQQLNKRLHRGSQKNTVFLHHIIAPGTMDEAVMSALQTKGATQDTVQNAVRVQLGK